MTEMICAKCGSNGKFKWDNFEVSLETSHDIPKYMGGTDKDGRHLLCKKCHKDYELQVLILGLQYWITQLPSKDKAIFIRAAKLVKSYYFDKREDIAI